MLGLYRVFLYRVLDIRDYMVREAVRYAEKNANIEIPCNLLNLYNDINEKSYKYCPCN